MIAGELDAPIGWLETLARQEQALYIEPGLWIAAEQYDQYEAAINGKEPDAAERIVRRLLRYRGAQSPEQICERYLWPERMVQQILTALCEKAEAVRSDGLYYHAVLFERAQRETVKMRRAQIRTLPPERYAALLTGRIEMNAPSDEKLEAALKSLSGLPYQPSLWESILLPVRVGGVSPGYAR